MFAHLAHASFGFKLNRKYKTIYRGIHYKHHLFSTLSIHDFLAKVKITACLKWATLFCTCPSHSAPACFMSVSALYEWLWNINRSTFQMKKTCENITFRRFITSGSLHYYSKTRDYSTEPLQWSSSNAIKLKMMYHRANKLTVKVTKTCKIHFNGHN